MHIHFVEQTSIKAVDALQAQTACKHKSNAVQILKPARHDGVGLNEA